MSKTKMKNADTMILHRQVWPAWKEGEKERPGSWVECYNPLEQTKCVVTHNHTSVYQISFQHMQVTTKNGK